MKVKDFNHTFKYAEKVMIVNNEWFNTRYWFWDNLTEKQLKKMWDLIVKQCGLDKECQVINFKNGMQLLNPYTHEVW